MRSKRGVAKRLMTVLLRLYDVEDKGANNEGAIAREERRLIAVLQKRNRMREEAKAKRDRFNVSYDWDK